MSVRAFLVLVAAISMMMATASAPAMGREKQRVITEDYQGGDSLYFEAGGVFAFSTTCNPSGTSCIQIVPRPGESKFTLEIADDSGLAVAAWILDDEGRTRGFVCGSRFTPLPVPAGKFFNVSLVNGTCPSGTQPSLPTSGTVTVKIYRGR